MNLLPKRLMSAEPGEIAPVALLAGDPLRAEYIAGEFLEGARRYSDEREMYGFTGLYRGRPVSVQGSGMGVASMTAYATRLMEDYGVKTLIRIGTCGSNHPDTHLRDVILATGASMESGTTAREFPDCDFVPTADFGLLRQAWRIAGELSIPVRVGPVVTGDLLHREPEEEARIAERWARYGMLGAEMEAAGLYVAASRHPDVRALAILTCSDHALYRVETTHEEREKSFRDMMRIALELAWKQYGEGAQ